MCSAREEEEHGCGFYALFGRRLGCNATGFVEIITSIRKSK